MSSSDPLFQCANEFELIKCMDKDRYCLLMGRYGYWQRQFDTDQVGVDGVTGLPAVRTFTSASATFTDFSPRDRLRIFSPAGDQGYYRIITITDDNTIIVNRDWEVGNLTALTWEVSQFDLYEDEQHDGDYRYVKRIEDVPLKFVLDPPTQELTRYGWDEKADALVTFSAGMHEDPPHNFIPKIGDLLKGPDQCAFQINKLIEFDYFTNSSNFLHYVGAADRMEGRPLPPDF